MEISIETNSLDRTMKKIIDTLSEACQVPIRDICVLWHDDVYFKAYVHGRHIDNDEVNKVIIKTWNVNEDNITIEKSPKCWWPLGSTGHVIEVKY